MSIISILILMAFWGGIALLALKKPAGILERAKLYAGRKALSARERRRSLEVSGAIARFKSSRKKEQLDQELSEALSYIRNLVILGRGENMSGELLMEELSDVTRHLSPVFLDMARSLHVNDKERASLALYKAMGDSTSRDVGAFLARWEDIPPKELASSVEAYRSALREKRETAQRRRDEVISDLVYFPVIANSMAVLLNFIYVAYFLEQKEALQILF